MIRSVIKHSYIKGRDVGVLGRAHINYIAHRSGEDRDQGGRKFFDGERDDIDYREVRQIMAENPDAVMHKLVISPGIPEVDIQEYTREVLQKFERDKGQELEWKAVIHDNTDHHHAHVVIMGQDKRGYQVRFTKDDYWKLRSYGDEYLEREHKLERYLDREIDQLIRSSDYSRGGDEQFNQLLYGINGDKDRQRSINGDEGKEREKKDRKYDDPERDRKEFEKLSDDMHKALSERESDTSLGKGYHRRTLEQQGRLSESHSDYSLAQAKERYDKISIELPELKEIMGKDLEYMQDLAREDRLNQQRDLGIDRLLGIDPNSQHQRSADLDAWITFETDRQMTSGEKGQDRDERNPTDDINLGGNG